MRGRGSPTNPKNRFEKLEVELDPGETEAPRRTEFCKDDTRSILSHNDSPDIGFDHSLNPYRGCEHGCAYCYARPTHEYLGFSAGLDFETRILVKERAPELLREALTRSGYRPKPLALSGVTDCYQPVEKRFRITRACLKVLAELRHPVTILTKNALLTRDLDLLSELARYEAVSVSLSVTSLDPRLSAKLEPRASSPRARLRAVRKLSEAGIPVGVMVAPIIPTLNEPELPAILEAAAEAGARYAGYTTVRLPWGVTEVFESWLETHFVGQKTKILDRIREMQGGSLGGGKAGFGKRLRGSDIHAEQIRALFAASCRRHGLSVERPDLSTEHFRKLDPHQPELAFLGSGE